MNGMIGLRIPSLMTDQDGWNVGHRAAWPWLVAAGLGTIAGGAVLIAVPEAVGVLVSCVVVWMVLMLIIVCVVATRAVHHRVPHGGSGA